MAAANSLRTTLHGGNGVEGEMTTEALAEEAYQRTPTITIIKPMTVVEEPGSRRRIRNKRPDFPFEAEFWPDKRRKPG